MEGHTIGLPGLKGSYRLIFDFRAYKALKELSGQSASEVYIHLSNHYDPVVIGYVLMAAARPEITEDELNQIEFSADFWAEFKAVFLFALDGSQMDDEDLKALGQAIKKARAEGKKLRKRALRSQAEAIENASKIVEDSLSQTSESQTEGSGDSLPENSPSANSDTSKSDGKPTTKRPSKR